MLEKLDEIDEIKNKLCYLLFEFVIHIIVGALIFSAIAIVAAGIDNSVIFLKNRGVDGIIIYGLIIVEYFLFLTGLILFFSFVYKYGMGWWRKV